MTVSVKDKTIVFHNQPAILLWRTYHVYYDSQCKR